MWDRSVDTDIGTVCNVKVTPETLPDYPFPDPLNPERFSHFPQTLADRGDTFAVASIGFTLFERAWTLAGMETILEAMITKPAFVHELLDRILDYDLQVTRRALSFDVDAMRFGDDWGHQSGLIMGPFFGGSSSSRGLLGYTRSSAPTGKRSLSTAAAAWRKCCPTLSLAAWMSSTLSSPK